MGSLSGLGIIILVADFQVQEKYSCLRHTLNVLVRKVIVVLGKWVRISFPILSSPGQVFLLPEMESRTSCSVIGVMIGRIGVHFGEDNDVRNVCMRK